MKQCPRCASEITRLDKVCPRCGLPIDKKFFEDEIESSSETKLTKVQKRERKKQLKKERKEAKKAQRLQEQKSNTDFSKYASNSPNKDDELVEALKKGRKYKNKNQQNPNFELDENGEFNIETKDVEIVGEETGKIIEDAHNKTYSVKKARGDYRQPKIRWWEIYKLADRSFARRKIKKEVVKASKIKPDFVKKSKLLLLAIFLGWSGAQNFYVHNKRKGWVSLISFLVWTGVVYLASKVTFFARIQISIGGFAGFINLCIWFGDIINIIFNNFRYRIQADAFIFKMNIKTRAKLGEKYINEELYFKPWWIRLKVWFEKKKRNYYEWKHDRRQRLIEKEKEKQAKLEEQVQIDAEIAEYETKENEKLKNQKLAENEKEIPKTKREIVEKQIKETNVLKQIETFEDESGKDISQKPKSPKKPKISVKTKKKK